LRLYGVNTLDYSSLVSSFTYQPSSHTAVWTFSQPIGTDKILVSLDDAVSDRTGNLLDGEWQGTTDAMPSGNGVEGGDFTYRMNVLPGDLDRNGAVNLFDLSYVQSHLGTTAHTLGYDAFADFDGSGTTTIVDRTAVLSHLFQSLPTGEPTAGGMAGDINGDRRVTLLDLARRQGRPGGTGAEPGEHIGGGIAGSGARADGDRRIGWPAQSFDSDCGAAGGGGCGYFGRGHCPTEWNRRSFASQPNTGIARAGVAVGLELIPEPMCAGRHCLLAGHVVQSIHNKRPASKQ
jgi:hypothetical protein